eukprot:2922-Heterococcus_DN1.PRE.1
MHHTLCRSGCFNGQLRFGTVPDDSLTWGLSICPEDHEDFKYVLYQFNPRKKEKGGILVQNDRIDAHWNQAEREPLDVLPVMFGRTFDLAVQINADGFHIAVDGKYSTSFQHRRPIEQFYGKSLVLQIPHKDDYHNPEVLVLHQLWWGNKPAIPNLGLKGGNNDDATANDDIFTNLHLSNLPLAVDKEEEIKLLQQLEELFKQFGDKTIIK